MNVFDKDDARWLLTWSVYIFTFAIPLYGSISVKLLLVSLVISFFTGEFNFRISRNWDVLLYLFILLIGVSYSDNWQNGLSVLETSFSLLAVSFIFYRSRFTELEIRTIFFSFILGLSIACLVCLASATSKFIDNGNIGAFSYYQLTDVINSHPTYLAYYLIAAITYSIYHIYYRIDGINIKVWVSITLFFFVMLILTGGRTAYVSLLLVLSFFILKFIIDDVKKRKIGAFILVIFILVALLGISYLSYFNDVLNVNNDYWERSQLWYSAINANPSPLFGVGTGDYKKVLNDYYISHNLEEFAKDSYNSHNQFVQFYFSNGIIGLVVLLIMIGRPLYLSVRGQNTIGILLIFPFVIYGITEVFLGRYQGVVFFALLHQVIIHQHYSNRPWLALKED